MSNFKMFDSSNQELNGTLTTLDMPEHQEDNDADWDQELPDLNEDLTAEMQDTPAGPKTTQDPLEIAVEIRIQDLEAGMAIAEWNAWADAYLQMLANMQGLSDVQLARFLELLVKHSKDKGYKPLTVKKYEKQWRELAGATASKQKQERLASGHPHQAALAYTVGNLRVGDAHDPAQDFETEAIFGREGGPLTNFTLLFEREIEVQDEFQPRKVFEGTLSIFGRKLPFRIDAADFADNQKLLAAVTTTAGSRAIIHCTATELRKAISALSWEKGSAAVNVRQVTSDFGWNKEGTAFLVPGGHVTADGWMAVDDRTAVRVDLKDEELARHLDLRFVNDRDELRRLKQHVVADLLQVQDRKVTYPLLGSVGVALLNPFAPNAQPFALWLKGLTGAGKSFSAKLFMNFFGDFPCQRALWNQPRMGASKPAAVLLF